jgi:hypothetical protein
MNLSISKEKTGSSVPMFGAAFKVKARLNASEAEVQIIVKKSMGGMEIAKLPNSMGSRYASEPLYLGEFLNRDWECKCKTGDDANMVEQLLIEGCKNLKYKMQEDSDPGPKTIEL